MYYIAHAHIICTCTCRDIDRSTISAAIYIAIDRTPRALITTQDRAAVKIKIKEENHGSKFGASRGPLVRRLLCKLAKLAKLDGYTYSYASELELGIVSY